MNLVHFTFERHTHIVQKADCNEKTQYFSEQDVFKKQWFSKNRRKNLIQKMENHSTFEKFEWRWPLKDFQARQFAK